MNVRPLFIPVLLGTTRTGCASAPVARFVHGEVVRRAGVETELVDIRDIDLPLHGEGEELKDTYFSGLVERADALVLVVPEYNHGYPGSLKRVLDTNLKEYIHKAVGICGVSAGGFGGTRVVEALLPVLRELGLVSIFWDVNFSNAQKLFGDDGEILDASYAQRVAKFLDELEWMATTLRQGRERRSPRE